MLNFIIFKYSYQLILCGLTFTPEFFYLSPLGMCLFFLLRRLRTRIRYFIGCLLLLISFYYPLIYPITYGFIQCNTYTSVRTLLLSDLKYDLSRIVIFLELISYLLRSFIGFPYVYLLFVIEIYNLITFFKPPSEEKDLKTMLESVKYLLKDYVALSKEYRAIFGTVKFNNRIFEEHQYSDSKFSNEFCNLEKQPDIKKHKPNEDSLIVFDLFTPLILVNIDNVYSFYALGALLLPTYTMSKMIYFVVFFYLLDLILLSLFLIPFCKMNFGNGSVYLRIMMLTTLYYLYKI